MAIVCVSQYHVVCDDCGHQGLPEDSLEGLQACMRERWALTKWGLLCCECHTNRVLERARYLPPPVYIG